MRFFGYPNSDLSGVGRGSVFRSVELSSDILELADVERLSTLKRILSTGLQRRRICILRLDNWRAAALSGL